MTDKMSGHVAVVTGGAQGLGEAVVRPFAERGAAGLVICGRNAGRGQTVARDLTNGGCKAVFVQADLAQWTTAAADSAFGTVDTLVNAAPITDRGTILDTTPELFDAIFAINSRSGG
jgi:NAD(P)-dependent dehydrogenase (short-subunit alcohol dehydrogenase family)